MTTSCVLVENYNYEYSMGVSRWQSSKSCSFLPTIYPLLGGYLIFILGPHLPSQLWLWGEPDSEDFWGTVLGSGSPQLQLLTQRMGEPTETRGGAGKRCSFHEKHPCSLLLNCEWKEDALSHKLLAAILQLQRKRAWFRVGRVRRRTQGPRQVGHWVTESNHLWSPPTFK